ncbi:1799_t:CDS:10 [Ambispora gerdemannii]|uniref:Transmembrane 9 superfamily member n=1 Tax=Ambispora gerdemannii TaxID=144530 RepID=A0A9N8V6P3_9GLOM|nr:1799_t:CDS:10 [Ambispora gerdemannii]
MAYKFKSLILLLVLSITKLATGFYIPGLSPTTYEDGDTVPLFVNKIFSDKTQLPFAYSDLPFVCPVEKGGNRWLNLGEVLRGDRIELSKFKIKALENKTCSTLCAVDLTAGKAMEAKHLVSKDYKVEWIIDNLPGATAYRTADGNHKQYEVGFNLGEKDEKKKDAVKAYLNNHFALKILYEKKNNDPNGILIVGFEVEPRSISGLKGACPDYPDNPENPKLEIDANTSQVTYSYSVLWQETKDVTWGNRWDLYLTNSDPQIHWYSIINSLIIALFLSAMVAIIMLRTLNRDIALYNEKDLKIEDQDDTTGWKLVHGDIFRPPKWGGFLAPLLGSGVQVLFMGIFTMILSLLGVLNPSYRGGFVSFTLFLFAFSSAFAGYYSSRMYKVFKGTAWKKNAIVTSILFPGFLFGVIFMLNFFIWSQHSSSAIPFGTFFVLISIWSFISMPLSLIGAYFGYKKAVIEHPVRTNQIPRQIPEQSWYLQPGVR